MLPYRRTLHRLSVGAAMNDEKLRQRSLLEEKPEKPLPKEVEAEAFELLVQLMIAVISAADGETPGS